MQQSLVTYLEQIESVTSAKKRMETQLYIGQKIQEGMLPKNFPNDSRCSLNAKVVPAKEVGGDLYDFTINGNRLYFSVGDVSGKGVPAAFVMAITRVMCHLFADLGLPVKDVATRINNSIAKNNDANMFVTLFFGCIDLETKKMEFCNAGHNPPIIGGSTSHGDFLEMKANIPIGLWPGFKFEGEEIDSIKGRALFIYTDGLNEAENRQQEQFGDDRLLSILRETNFESSQQVVETLSAEIEKHRNGAEPNDDLTMVCLRVS
jgi:sigma-B regulation protein RsbU (phosphoserine phosphatase)